MKALKKSVRLLFLANKKKASLAGGAIGVLSDVSFPGVHCEEHFVFEVVSFEITKGNSERVAFEYVSPPF